MSKFTGKGAGSAGKHSEPMPSTGARAAQNISNVLGSQGVRDGNIANVGAISLDTIQADDPAVGITVQMALAKMVTNITQHATDPQVTTVQDHGFAVDTIVVIEGIRGMVEINPSVNGSIAASGRYKVKAVVDAKNFTLKQINGSNLDTSGFGAFQGPNPNGKVNATQFQFVAGPGSPAMHINTTGPGGFAPSYCVFNTKPLFGQGIQISKADAGGSDVQTLTTSVNPDDVNPVWSHLSIGQSRAGTVKFVLGGGHSLANNASHTIILGDYSSGGVNGKIISQDVVLVTKDLDQENPLNTNNYDIVLEGVSFQGFPMASLPNGSNGALSGVTKANPGVFTTAAAHALAPGNYVVIGQLTGTGWSGLNNQVFQVHTTPGQDQFTLRTIGGGSVDTTSFGTLGGLGAGNIAFYTGPGIKLTLTNRSGGNPLAAGHFVTFNWAAL